MAKNLGRWALTLALGLSMACEATAPTTSESGDDTGAREEIKGGKATTEFPAVGMLYDGKSFCTGTLIEPRKVLTAAHCLPKFDSSQLAFYLGPSTAAFETAIPVVSMTSYSGYDAAKHAHDIAFVTLQNNAPVAPMKLLGSMDQNWVGEELVYVGYGATAKGAKDAGIKRAASIEISAVTEDEFSFAAGAASTCYGDSGGPAFARLGTKYFVAGVHAHLTLSASTPTSPDPECDVGGADVRVDVYKSFLANGNTSSGAGGTGGTGGTGGSGSAGAGGTGGGDTGFGGGGFGGDTGIGGDGAGGVPSDYDPCQGETYEGRCDGETLIWCETSEVNTLTCDVCGYDAEGGYYDCL